MMKKFLKSLSLVMALVMCFTMVFTAAVSADEATPTITFGVKDSVEPGAVSITVDAANFADVAGVQGEITVAGLDDAAVVAGTIKNVVIDAGVISFAEEGEANDEGTKITMADGTLFTITGTAVEGTPITLAWTADETKACDTAEVLLTLDYADKTVEVKKAVVEPEEPTLDENITFTASIEVDKKLGISYLFTNAQLEKYDHCELVVTPTKYSTDAVGNKIAYNEYDAEPIVYADSAWTLSGAYSFVSYQGIAMYELGLEISAFVKCYDADGNYVAYSNTVSGTPADFAKATFALVADSTAVRNARMKVALAELLVLGGDAQRYFQTRATADCDLVAVTTYVDAAGDYDYASFATTDISNLETANDTDWADTSVIASGAFLKSVAVSAAPAASYMINTNGVADASKFSLEVSYTSLYPNTEDVTVTVSGDMWNISGTWYMYDFNETRLYDSNKVVTAKLYYDGALLATDTYSIESFAGSQLNSANAQLAAACSSIARFGVAARAFFGYNGAAV